MGAILAFFRRKPPETPIKGPIPRVKNVGMHHFRGLLGVLLPVIIISWQLDTHVPEKTTFHIWILMAFFFLFQPVTLQVTGSIPIFAFPMFGILSTAETVKCYFNEGAALFVIGGMLHLLLNNSGFDRRLALFILCKGDAKYFSPIKLLIKSAFAAFFLSIFCHRLIVASTIIQYVAPTLMDMQVATRRYRASEPNFDSVRYIICNAISISCSIGGIAIVHSSYCTLAFRAIFYDLGYPDFMNYAQYSAFAVPVAIALFVINIIYHGLLLKFASGKPISAGRMAEVRAALIKHKSEIPPKITNHEKLTVFFLFLALLAFFGRHVYKMNAGWNKLIYGADGFLDGSVAAMFVIFLHVLPRSCNFIKIVRAKKKSQLPPTKPESAILFYRFVDKNTNYGYFFLIGAGLALAKKSSGGKDSMAAVVSSKLSFLTNLDFCIAILIIALMTVFITNIISGVACIAIWLPVVLCLAHEQQPTSPWVTKMFRPALTVGIASSFGYISPFLYTPAYFCYHTGKVPRRAMLKFAVAPCILSALVLYLAMCFYSPAIFGDEMLPTLPASAVTTTGPGGPAPTAPPAGLLL
ncbi:protein I'm not dead yet-like [Plodia interpunctella]|uniref:protein I'm not dead yet-like n=1 Tax=Plodia interpunctella TaxID=58824 RepID=UPI002368230D|nr:protein I'm not dead yet-like [Plodia interpunctella]